METSHCVARISYVLYTVRFRSLLVDQRDRSTSCAWHHTLTVSQVLQSEKRETKARACVCEALVDARERLPLK